MGGLNHDFFLLDRRQVDYWDWAEFINGQAAILIHDEFLRYMEDSLKWVPCQNPAHGEKKGLLPHEGLNFYGPTIIEADGARVVSEVFAAWAALFSTGPARLELTSSLPASVDGGPFERHKIVADRNEIVESLLQIASIGKQVAERPDELYILHLGI